MPDEHNSNDENDPIRSNKGAGEDLLMVVLKVLGITVAVLVLLVVIGFGLVVGFCALGGH